MAEIFDDTADYYAAFRPAYPEAVFEWVIKLSAPDAGADLAADLGCGTGELAIPLSPAFKRMHAVDVSQAMIEQGRLKSNRRGIANIVWKVGKVEEVLLEPDSFKLIIIGQAFHWMDEALILQKSHQALKKDGVFALVGGKSLWNGTEEWQLKTKEVIQRYLGRERKAGYWILILYFVCIQEFVWG